MDASPTLPLELRRSEELPQVRDVEFIEMPVRQILNRCENPAMPFRWTINPYRGCEFGCVYCYARYTHEFLELRDPMDFERRIFVKRMAAEVLARTLSRTPIGADQIAIGTATDPYQPAERKFGLTRSMLEVFASLGGLDLSITTKSALIARDIDLLRADQFAVATRRQFLVDYDKSAPAADARTARAATGPPAACAGATDGCRNSLQRIDDADDTRPDRQSDRDRKRDSRGTGDPARPECGGDRYFSNPRQPGDSSLSSGRISRIRRPG